MFIFVSLYPYTLSLRYYPVHLYRHLQRSIYDSLASMKISRCYLQELLRNSVPIFHFSSFRCITKESKNKHRANHQEYTPYAVWNGRAHARPMNKIECYGNVPIYRRAGDAQSVLRFPRNVVTASPRSDSAFQVSEFSASCSVLRCTMMIPSHLTGLAISACILTHIRYSSKEQQERDQMNLHWPRHRS